MQRVTAAPTVTPLPMQAPMWQPHPSADKAGRAADARIVVAVAGGDAVGRGSNAVGSAGPGWPPTGQVASKAFVFTTCSTALPARMPAVAERRSQGWRNH